MPSTLSNPELAASYAALILADNGVDTTVRTTSHPKQSHPLDQPNRQSDKLKTMIKAAKVDDKEPIWCSLFAKALEGKDVKELLLNVGFGGGSSATAPATGSPTATAGSGTALAEEKKEEKEEEKEESDDDIGFGRFD